VGGVHLLTLARLGIGRFTIADFDVFDIVNFNRQVGATVGSLHQPKIDVLANMARLILIPRLIFVYFQKGYSLTRWTPFLTRWMFMLTAWIFLLFPLDA
jgi:hypothetical protein